MSHPPLTLARMALAVACSAALSACVVAPARPYYAPRAEMVVTDVAPPPAYVEVVPAVPFAGAVWINGYWGWHGGRHAWVGGHWEQARPGYAWHPHRWVQHDGRWHLEGGVWLRG